MTEKEPGKERLFEGTRVYYSGSIKGAPEIDPEFAWKLVQYMLESGANVLSEHVAARSFEEMDEIRSRRTGIPVEVFKNMPRDLYVRDIVRKQDLEWVEEATHVVALVNAASHGVGMELEHAILKPRLGMNLTPILCLIHEDLYSKLSGMVTGVYENPEFYVMKYKTIDEAKNHISNFLTGKLQK